jgi:hypothetical protein
VERREERQKSGSRWGIEELATLGSSKMHSILNEDC